LPREDMSPKQGKRQSGRRRNPCPSPDSRIQRNAEMQRLLTDCSLSPLEPARDFFCRGFCFGERLEFAQVIFVPGAALHFPFSHGLLFWHGVSGITRITGSKPVLPSRVKSLSPPNANG